MNIPNLLTIARILLVPVTISLLISGDYPLAFGVFILAGLTDAADGWLARVTRTQTELGAYLDPLADKALLVSSYAALGGLHLIAPWLVIIVISRDVLIIGALLLSRFMERPYPVRPLPISKVNTLTQIIFVGLVLANLSFGLPPSGILQGVAILVALFTLASGAAYLKIWFAHMGALKDSQ
jgi:cardiolipin synthase